MDHATEGWGHILADQIHVRRRPGAERGSARHWVDYGADFYASSTFTDAPGGQQISSAG